MMQTSALLIRSLGYFWRTNLAVVFGVATAVSVLAGALLVGDSVRGSLRDLFVQRLGNTGHIVFSTGFFREGLAGELQADRRFNESFGGDCPLIVLSGLVIDEASGRRASSVQIYGVDDRFWEFHRRGGVKGPAEREVLLSPDLAGELGTGAGQAVLLRVEKPSAIPAGSLHGRKEELGRTVRLIARAVLDRADLGEFSLRPSQGPVRAAFVSLSRLQKDIEQAGRVNTILIRDRRSPASDRTSALPSLLAEVLKDTFALDDLGIKLRLLDGDRGVALETESAIISDALYANANSAAAKLGAGVIPILSYLANSIRVGQREIPYSLVTAIDLKSIATLSGAANFVGANESESAAPALPPIWLNEWAASDLEARPGNAVTLDYYLWKDEGTLETHSAQFRLAGIVPIKDQAADRDYVPDYPGITTTESIGDWDPPFPVDLKKVRPRDEDYWHKYRTTPKAFIPLEAGQQLWQSRYGKLTSLRVLVPPNNDPQTFLESIRQELRRALDPTQNGFSITPVRSEGLEASRGATDFGEYFLYFSFFLVVAALLLASLFFKLGIEQRLREIGTLRAVGFPASRVRTLFLREGIVLASLGSVVGVMGAIGYGELMMYGLRTWWVGAVGTTDLSLHLSPVSLLMGGAGGIVIALLCIAWTLRTLAHSSPRGLLSGSLEAAAQSALVTRAGARGIRSGKLGAGILAAAGFAILILAWRELVGAALAFFVAGALFLAAMLCLEHGWLSGKARRVIEGRGWWPVSRLGFRNATHHPGRSILCIALIASAAFIIVAVDAFKRDAGNSDLDKKSGSGGFALVAESMLPIYHDPNTEEGKEALGLFSQRGVNPEAIAFTGFRLRPGDDASCLNLYQPRNPRVLGASQDFIKSGRFVFQESLAQTTEEEENPWLLLGRDMTDGAIPVIADANSMTYVLHRKLGEEITVSRSNGEAARLRLVGALGDSIFQSELVMSESNFLRLFPERGGYGFFLLELAPGAASEAAGVLEEELADFGFDAMATSERLASFHRVENTYLSTFQTLGGLGLVLGTLGLATVLLRNVLERRRELALLRAIGYNSRHFALMVITENAFLVWCGLVIGALCALVAIAPAFISRGGHVPALSLWLLSSVFATGLLASLAATIAALRAPLLPSLRAE